MLFLIIGGQILCGTSCDRKQAPADDPKLLQLLTLADSINHFSPKTADSIYRHLLSFRPKLSINLEGEALLGRSVVFSNQSTFDSATILLNKATELAVSHQDTSLLMDCHLTRGNLHLHLSNFKQSKLSFADGLQLAQKANNSHLIHVFQMGLGNVQLNDGDYMGAVKTFTESLRVDDANGNEENQAIAHESIGMALSFTNNYADGIIHLKKAISLSKKNGLTRKQAKALQDLGIIYKNYGYPDSALMVYRESLKMLSDLGDSANMIMVRYNMGLILKNRQHYEEAEREMNEIYEFCTRKNIAEGQVASLSTLAAVYEQTGRAEMGLAAIDTTIAIGIKNEFTANLWRFYNRKHEILSKLGRYREAYEYQSLAEKLSDSLFSRDKQTEISTLKTIYNTEKIDAENALLKVEVKHQQNRMVVIWILLAFGLMIASAGFYMMRLRMARINDMKLLAEERSKRAEQEIKNKEILLENIKMDKQLQEQDMVFKTLIQADLVNLNRSVKEKLEPFILAIPRKKQQEEFERTLYELTRESNRDSLTEFEQLFKQLHNSFYDKLLEAAPDLTKTELQVCALVRLNLYSKDIARISHINVNSVDITRHHIRKKLNLVSNESLTVFLLSL